MKSKIVEGKKGKWLCWRVRPVTEDVFHWSSLPCPQPIPEAVGDVPLHQWRSRDTGGVDWIITTVACASWVHVFHSVFDEVWAE